MLRRLRDWVDGSPAKRASGAEAAIPDRRLDQRHDFSGTTIVVRQGRIQSLLQLRDVSAEGACGISEIPLALGASVFLQLRRPHFHAARVLWVRRARVGFKFIRPLDPDDLARLHQRRKTPSVVTLYRR